MAREHPIGPSQAAFADYFRCPEALASVNTSSSLSERQGYFTFRGLKCFGRAAGAEPAECAEEVAREAHLPQGEGAGRSTLPFDLAEVVTNLREERYRSADHGLVSNVASMAWVQRLYYQARPHLPVGVRKHLQQVRLRGWERIAFPRWPVDTTVDDLMREAAGVVLRATGADRLPFIWFWPDGAPSCTTLTHDVEGASGVDFCSTLIDLDDRHGFKAAYQLIPEGHDPAWHVAASIRERGCEVNLHDLNHDGRLYSDRAEFLRRAARINDYTRRFGCQGFRSGAMYREQSWYDAFEFDYDMSVPNVAHLEPQRGGCCTVLPYFVGRLLELPLTTVQDYSLFFVLGDYSTRLWEEQIRHIRDRHGLISVIAHPDYLTEPRERAVYEQLLTRLAALRDAGETWVAQPGDLNRWWRARRDMTLERSGTGWRVAGPDSERARVAYARLDGDRVVYALDGVA